MIFSLSTSLADETTFMRRVSSGRNSMWSTTSDLLSSFLIRRLMCHQALCFSKIIEENVYSLSIALEYVYIREAQAFWSVRTEGGLNDIFSLWPWLVGSIYVRVSWAEDVERQVLLRLAFVLSDTNWPLCTQIYSFENTKRVYFLSSLSQLVCVCARVIVLVVVSMLDYQKGRKQAPVLPSLYIPGGRDRRLFLTGLFGWGR